jgi:Protein of unknown function (DUF3306)
MSDDVGLLARWARRKRDAALPAHRRPKPKDTGDGAASEEAAASLPPEETPLDFDPASLPPIESIGAGSDIRPFLAAGVPADLTRAALRRAWSADPTIRDFIGLSENSWDFNAPGGVPGFGSLPEVDARRLLARVIGETEALDPARPAADRLSDDQALLPSSEAGHQAACSVPDQTKLIRETDADHGNPMPRGETNNIAIQHEMGERESRPSPPRRRHGGALPD